MLRTSSQSWLSLIFVFQGGVLVLILTCWPTSGSSRGSGNPVCRRRRWSSTSCTDSGKSSPRRFGGCRSAAQRVVYMRNSPRARIPDSVSSGAGRRTLKAEAVGGLFPRSPATWMKVVGTRSARSATLNVWFAGNNQGLARGSWAKSWFAGFRTLDRKRGE